MLVCRLYPAILVKEPGSAAFEGLAQGAPELDCMQGLLRLAGTLMGAATGVAIYWFVYLCNGLSRGDHPQVNSAGAGRRWRGQSAVRSMWRPCNDLMQLADAIAPSFAVPRSSSLPRPFWRWPAAPALRLQPARRHTRTCRRASAPAGCVEEHLSAMPRSVHAQQPHCSMLPSPSADLVLHTCRRQLAVSLR